MNFLFGGIYLQLKDILTGLDYVVKQGSINVDISDIVYDSRNAVLGCCFVCLSGSNVDGHKFALDAVKNGAKAIVCERELNIENVCCIIVDNTRYALSIMSANFFDNPAKELITIGITGTKGKTTTACMIKSILEADGISTGVIGTLGVIIGNDTIKTDNTTPESYDIQKYLRLMINSGIKAVVMEVSSLGLKWYRVNGFTFDYAVFTNFSVDHIGDNEHKDIQEYLDCKAKLFSMCKNAVINIDDEKSRYIIKRCNGKIKTFGFSKDADFIASNENLILKPGYLGVHFDLTGEINLSIDVDIPGKFSVYNALAAIAVCINICKSTNSIIEGINTVKVPGRIESVKVPGNYTLLIDYAHNAVSMENVLNTLREYKPNRLITMFGAGGNRAKSRRFEMGEVSGRLSDLSVITEDNSRYEDVMDIIADIKVGIDKTNGKYVVIPNRKDAIEYCIKNAQDNDIIVLAGKGHEDYQEIKGVKYHFDEREVIKDIISKL